jgi:hypothetical protein
VALAFLASFFGAGNQKKAPEKPQDGAGADQISAQDFTKEGRVCFESKII